MKIAICDDEKTIRESLGSKVKRLYPEAELEFYETGEELLARGDKPDILFLDIQMPGMDGMNVARELRRKGGNTILIFVTATEECVFQAFDVGAFHYLIKPFSDEKFRKVLTNAVNKLNDKSGVLPAEEKYMIVNSGGNHIKILMRDIVYVEVFNRKVVIHKLDEAVECYGKLSDLEKSLGEDFFRPHRAFLIHFKYVVKYNATSITMKNGTVLMARANYQEFVRRYLKYNQRKGREII